MKKLATIIAIIICVFGINLFANAETINTLNQWLSSGSYIYPRNNATPSSTCYILNGVQQCSWPTGGSVETTTIWNMFGVEAPLTFREIFGIGTVGFDFSTNNNWTGQNDFATITSPYISTNKINLGGVERDTWPATSISTSSVLNLFTANSPIIYTTTSNSGNFSLTTSTANKFLDGTGNWSIPAGGSSTPPGGNVGDIQYNNSGAFGGLPQFSFVFYGASTTAWNNATNKVNTSSTFWDLAYSWGNHALAGYLKDLLGGLNGIFGNTTTTNAVITNATTTNLNVVNASSSNLNSYSYTSAGTYSMPTIIDNGDGSITVSAGEYTMFADANFNNPLNKYSIATTTVSLINQSNNYVYATNNPSPQILAETDRSNITQSNVIPIATVYRDNNYLHILYWDSMGKGLANKLSDRLVRTERFVPEPGGLSLGEKATRTVTVTTGVVWYGGSNQTLSAFDSSTSTSELFFIYHSGGNWLTTTTSQYNNTQYDNGTNLATLTNNKYTVNWIFRGVEQENHSYMILGNNSFNTITAASASTVPNPPSLISSHAILVGRIIVKKGVDTASEIDSAFSTQFTVTPISDHNQLSNLQGGTTNEYYHLTAEEYGGNWDGKSLQASGISTTNATSTNIFATVLNSITAWFANLFVSGTTETTRFYENSPLIYDGHKVNIISPYGTTTNEYSVALHNHTTGSPDAVNTPSQVVNFYKNNGYDAVEISDHDFLTANPNVSGITFISGVEESVGNHYIQHINSINATHVIDIGSVTHTDAQLVIDDIKSQGALPILNHPNEPTDGFTLSQMDSLNGYMGINIFDSEYATNTSIAYSTNLWDSLLSQGKKLYAIADNDCHDISKSYCLISSVNVFSNSSSSSDIMDSLIRGNYYSSVTSTKGSMKITVSQRSITASTTALSTIKFIINNGVVAQTASNVTSSTYNVVGNEKYIRVEIINNATGGVDYSNPIYIELDDFQEYGGLVSGNVLFGKGATSTIFYVSSTLGLGGQYINSWNDLLNFVTHWSTSSEDSYWAANFTSNFNNAVTASSSIPHIGCSDNQILIASGGTWICGVQTGGVTFNQQLDTTSSVTFANITSTNYITLGGVSRNTWPTGGSGGSSFWATSTDSLTGYPNLGAGYAIVIGASATTTNVKLEVQGNSYFNGTLAVNGTVSSTGGLFSNMTSTNMTLGGIQRDTWPSAANLPWTTLTANATATTNMGYLMNSSTAIYLALPTLCSVGDELKVAGRGTGGFRITQGAGQQIHVLDLDTTSGVTGYVSSSYKFNFVELLCIGADTEWSVINIMGNVYAQ